MRTTIVALAFGSVLVAPLSGQVSPSWSTTVTIVVNGVTAGSQVGAWYGEELEQLQGVLVADADPEWNVSLTVLENRVNGTLTGYTLSEAIFHRINIDDWEPVAAIPTAVGSGELEDAIRDLATRFKEDQLEPSRAAWYQDQTHKPD